jgi:hypothetical protein
MRSSTDRLPAPGSDAGSGPARDASGVPRSSQLIPRPCPPSGARPMTISQCARPHHASPSRRVPAMSSATAPVAAHRRGNRASRASSRQRSARGRPSTSPARSNRTQQTGPKSPATLEPSPPPVAVSPQCQYIITGSRTAPGTTGSTGVTSRTALLEDWVRSCGCGRSVQRVRWAGSRTACRLVSAWLINDVPAHRFPCRGVAQKRRAASQVLK